jgi:hypothetical protein
MIGEVCVAGSNANGGEGGYCLIVNISPLFLGQHIPGFVLNHPPGGVNFPHIYPPNALNSPWADNMLKPAFIRSKTARVSVLYCRYSSVVSCPAACPGSDRQPEA